MLLCVRVWAGFPGHSQPCCLPPSHKIPKGLAILPVRLLIQQPRGTRPSHNDLTCSDWSPGESVPSSEEAMEVIAFWALTYRYSELVSRGSVKLLREPSSDSFGGSPTKPWGAGHLMLQASRLPCGPQCTRSTLILIHLIRVDAPRALGCLCQPSARHFSAWM